MIKPSDVSLEIRWDCNKAYDFAIELLTDVNDHQLVREITALPELIDLVREIAKGPRNLIKEDYEKAKAILSKIDLK